MRSGARKATRVSRSAAAGEEARTASMLLVEAEPAIVGEVIPDADFVDGDVGGGLLQRQGQITQLAGEVRRGGTLGGVGVGTLDAAEQEREGLVRGEHVQVDGAGDVQLVEV